MESKHTHVCEVKPLGGSPALYVDGEAVPAAAYISYLNERARYADFAKAGYRLYSLPVFFAGRGINTDSGIYPLRRGIFDDAEAPWDEFDAELDAIIKACPDALIFPRVNLMMPEWWEDEHPDELNVLDDGSVCRESFSSKIWLKDVKNLLEAFIERMAGSKYAANIIGYHIADGMTEEWFHFGYSRGGRGKCAERGFMEFLREKYPTDAKTIKAIPDFSAYSGGRYLHNDRAVALFCEYTNNKVADAICDIARFVKEKTDGKLLVGTFYGYTLEVCDARFGTHALKKVLQCRDIDFISSPVSYMYGRPAGIDSPYMSVYDSERLHGKLYMAENDNRTYLSKYLSESRPNSCPEGSYKSPIWLGPDSKEVSRYVLANAFARNLTHGAGFWWFDMWGGWYADDDIMSDMRLYAQLSKEALTRPSRECAAEVAVIASEEAHYLTSPSCPDITIQCSRSRLKLGYAGAPYDIYDIYDIEMLPDKYKAIIFLGISGSEQKAYTYAAEHGDKLCIFTGDGNQAIPDEKNIVQCGYAPEPNELRELYAKAGVHIYADSDDVIHAGSGYIGIHAASAGEKKIKLPNEAEITPLYPAGSSYKANEIKVTLKQYETRIYKIE